MQKKLTAMKRIRKARGLRQKDVAEKLGIATHSYTRYECGDRRHQIPEETLLHRRQITCQTYAHIHTSKEKRRQDDHYHTLYVIFLFHQI